MHEACLECVLKCKGHQHHVSRLKIDNIEVVFNQSALCGFSKTEVTPSPMNRPREPARTHAAVALFSTKSRSSKRALRIAR